MMEIISPNYFECVESAIVTTNEPYVNHQGWTAFGSSSEQTLSISPHLLDQNSMEEIGQFCENQEVTPSKISQNVFREASIPVEQLRNETLWPQQQSDGFQQRQKALPSHSSSQNTSSQHSNPSRRSFGDLVEAENNASQPVINSEPLKCRRGRPRLHAPTIDVDTASISSIRAAVSREYYLEKNRVAAEKCRQRRKEYIARLTADASDLSSKNQSLKAQESHLREQVLNLKNEVLRHATCGSWAIDEYITQSAGSQLAAKAGPLHTRPRRDSSQTQATTASSSFGTASESLACHASSNSSVDVGEYESILLLKEYEKEDGWTVEMK